MAKRPVQNLLGLAVLAYLTQRPMHAYELHRQLLDYDAASTFKFSYGALYSVVRQLDRAELIQPVGTDRQGNLPERTSYEITAAGQQELGSWLQELVSEPRHEYPAFAAALSLLVVLPPEEATRALRDRLAVLAEQRAATAKTVADTTDTGVHPLFLVEEDYRLALLDAETAFVQRLLGQIADEQWTAEWREHHNEDSQEGH